MSESATPEPGPLSVEAATALLLPANPVEEQQQASEAPAGAEEPQEPQGETSSPEEAAAEPEQPAEGEETEAEVPAVEPLDPPKYWSTEAKAKFAALPPELQAVVLEQEGPREEAAAKAKAEAAEVRRNADAELAKVNELAAALVDRLPQWQEAFKDKWGAEEPNWVALAQEHGTEAVSLAKMQYDADKAKMLEARDATLKAQQLAREQTLKTEFARLAELAPDLVDPATGGEKRQAIVKYLDGLGIPQHAIAQISAAEMVIARKAMLYDQGQAALSAAPKPKPAAQPQRPTVRPGGAPAQSSQTSAAKQAQGRFYAKPTVDNAVAMLLASKG